MDLQVFSLWGWWDAYWVCYSLLCIHWFWFSCQHCWRGKCSVSCSYYYNLLSFLVAMSSKMAVRIEATWGFWLEGACFKFIFCYLNRWRTPNEICLWVLRLLYLFAVDYICWSLLSLLVWYPIMKWTLILPFLLHLLAMGCNGLRKYISY